MLSGLPMRWIYLIGTDHRYQAGFAFGVGAAVFREFREFLRGTIARHNLRGIAEEMSVEALQRVSLGLCSRSLAFDLAAELGLCHRYCDPERATRQARGIVSAQDRERYWIERLEAFDRFPALFIAGSEHVDSFKRLLREAGFQPFVVARDWEPPADAGPVA